jgi:hypothetical protein
MMTHDCHILGVMWRAAFLVRSGADSLRRTKRIMPQPRKRPGVPKAIGRSPTRRIGSASASIGRTKGISNRSSSLATPCEPAGRCMVQSNIPGSHAKPAPSSNDRPNPHSGSVTRDPLCAIPRRTPGEQTRYGAVQLSAVDDIRLTSRSNGLTRDCNLATVRNPCAVPIGRLAEASRESASLDPTLRYPMTLPPRAADSGDSLDGLAAGADPKYPC